MKNHNRGRRRLFLGTAAIAALHCTAPAASSPPPTKTFHLAPQKLGSALRAVGRESGREIMFSSEAVVGKEAPALDGTMTADQAVAKLLEGSGLAAEYREDVILIRGRLETTSGEIEGARSPDIVVTGSRIRGAPIASPLIRLDQNTMLNEGHTSLASALKDIPGNFGGGQNPGIGLGTTGSFDDSGASTINLRGLGGDATLTVLNGHRLPNNADFGTTDISNIPFDAIDRIEIVPDGSSALYGSDAVAGVANIILKRDFDGVRASARVGTTSDGGGSQRQYDLTAGTVWSTGGVIAAYDYEKDQPIIGYDRFYTSEQAPGLYLTPALRHHNILISAHQDITPAVTFSLDALYNERLSRLDYSLDPSGDVLTSGGSVRSRDTSYSVAPSVSVHLPAQWHATISGMYGEDRDHYASLNFSDGASVYPFYATYFNRTEVAEVSADGPLVDLGAGDVRAALGGGYRFDRYEEAASAISANRSDFYAFGELNVPIISAAQHLTAIRALSVTAAFRYENYPGIASVVSPKFGAILSPTSDFDLKATWGRSFKAPTFDQRFVITRVGIEPAAAYGATDLPSSATVLELVGGNPVLKPERATSWTIGGSIHPSILKNLQLDVSYFHVDYQHRVVQPITFTAQALVNPIYADLVNTHPSAQEIADAIASGAIQNVVGGPFNPDDVTAIIDNRYLNAASQSIHGVDASVRYNLPLASGESLLLVADATYLVSRQKLSDLQPSINLAGSIFNPPHYRAHAGATWDASPIVLSAFINYTGGLKDVRSTPSRSIGSMTSADLTLRYQIPPSHSFLAGWDILLSVQNILNAKPPLIDDTQNYEQPYDAANFSPVGRLLSVRVAKTW